VFSNTGGINVDSKWNVLMGNFEGKIPNERSRHRGNYVVKLGFG